MQDSIRIETEKKIWDKLSPKYDQIIQKYWKIYATYRKSFAADKQRWFL